ELTRADLAIVVIDARAPHIGLASVSDAIIDVPARLFVYNKIDLLESDYDSPGPADIGGENRVFVSAQTGAGLDALHARLRA
ncbi:tRNA uridine-5-carboxymethylaminomethyl(34) synthesis GTPase MnmE, partial [Lysobacter sp. 2RAB21]